MTTQELKQQAHKEFDEQFKYFSGHEMLQTNQGHNIIKSFIDSLIDKAVQMTEGRIKESVLMNMTSNKNGEYISVGILVSLITNKSDINK